MGCEAERMSGIIQAACQQNVPLGYPGWHRLVESFLPPAIHYSLPDLLDTGKDGERRGIVNYSLRHKAINVLDRFAVVGNDAVADSIIGRWQAKEGVNSVSVVFASKLPSQPKELQEVELQR